MGLQDELNQILGGEIPGPFVTEPDATPKNGRRKRKVSAVARARMDAAQQARWAAKQGGAQPEMALATNGTLEIRLSGGRSVIVEPGFDAAHLRAVLAALEARA